MLPRRRGARKRCYGETSWATFSYGMTNLALGEYRTFKQRSLNLLSISTAKELGIEMPPSWLRVRMPLLIKRIRA
jgi:hypothetical protein